MNETNWERWGAATGYLVFALGVAAAAFERGAPPANAPVEETLAFFAEYRAELLAQSLLFVLSAGVYLWFFGSLRSFLLRADLCALLADGGVAGGGDHRDGRAARETDECYGDPRRPEPPSRPDRAARRLTGSHGSSDKKGG